MSVLFYSVKDILVFYTILYTLKKKYRLKIPGLVCMYNHYHMNIQADSQRTVSDFICEFESTYSREFNRELGISGALFGHAYGLANKIGDKKKRDACAYLYNNPVEKRLCRRAEDYRWNFLAYYRNDHPFSEKLVVRRASTEMKKALAEVKYLFNNGQYVNYTFLKKWFGILDQRETNQLIDQIISKFRVVDYEEAIRLYGSYETMLTAINTNTGSEHDIHEDYSEKSYVPYNKLFRVLTTEYGFTDPKEVLKLDIPSRRKLCEEIIRKKGFPRFIVETTLHIFEPD